MPPKTLQPSSKRSRADGTPEQTPGFEQEGPDDLEMDEAPTSIQSIHTARIRLDELIEMVRNTDGLRDAIAASQPGLYATDARTIRKIFIMKNSKSTISEGGADKVKNAVKDAHHIMKNILLGSKRPKGTRQIWVSVPIQAVYRTAFGFSVPLSAENFVVPFSDGWFSPNTAHFGELFVRDDYTIESQSNAVKDDERVNYKFIKLRGPTASKKVRNHPVYGREVTEFLKAFEPVRLFAHKMYVLNKIYRGNRDIQPELERRRLIAGSAEGNPISIDGIDILPIRRRDLISTMKDGGQIMKPDMDERDDNKKCRRATEYAIFKAARTDRYDLFRPRKYDAKRRTCKRMTNAELETMHQRLQSSVTSLSTEDKKLLDALNARRHKLNELASFSKQIDTFMPMDDIKRDENVVAGVRTIHPDAGPYERAIRKSLYDRLKSYKFTTEDQIGELFSSEKKDIQTAFDKDLDLFIANSYADPIMQQGISLQNAATVKQHATDHYHRIDRIQAFCSEEKRETLQRALDFLQEMINTCDNVNTSEDSSTNRGNGVIGNEPARSKQPHVRDLAAGKILALRRYIGDPTVSDNLRTRAGFLADYLAWALQNNGDDRLIDGLTSIGIDDPDAEKTAKQYLDAFQGDQSQSTLVGQDNEESV